MMMKYTPSQEMADRIVSDFTYHAPQGDQPKRYDEIRAKFREMAQWLVQMVPPSREQSLALTSLEQANFYANAAVARHDEPTDQGNTP